MHFKRIFRLCKAAPYDAAELLRAEQMSLNGSAILRVRKRVTLNAKAKMFVFG